MLTLLRGVLQELCLGGSLRDKVLKQMTTWNKVRLSMLCICSSVVHSRVQQHKRQSIRLPGLL